ncbi:MAG: hypothetical protein SO161_07455 [Treponema sp.]|nr:hypothetical protein [Treponema sp.]
MKKLSVICLLIAIIMSHIFAQDNTLYDVNYDEPLKTSNYDDSLAEFQKIYLQYEDAIKIAGNIIRQEEKDAYNKELEKLKEQERIRTDTTIEKMRLAIYGNEVESVRKQETERLTAELTEKISADLNQELSAKYEKIKDDEIAKLYADLKKQAYDETDATTQRVKSISSASAKVIIIVLILVIIFIGIKTIINTFKRKAEEKDHYNSIVAEYEIRLKSYNGDPYYINEEIKKVYGQKEKEKTLRIKALKEVQNKYSGDLSDVQDYKNDFEGYKNKFSMYMEDKVWKNDKFDFNKIKDELKKIYKKYKATGQDLFYSLKLRKDADKTNAENLLRRISSELEDMVKEIDSKTVEEQFSNEKKQLAKDFAVLAKSFKKGEF